MSKRSDFLSAKETQILTSTNRVYKRFKRKDGTIMYNVYDRQTDKRLRTATANQAHSEFKLIKMNQTIDRIKNNNNITQKEARDRYFIKQAEILEGRINNIMKIENLNRTQAENHYKHLIDTKQYGRLKKYS